MNSFNYSGALKPLLFVIMFASALAARGDFSNTVQSFHPIAYWPLNETNQPPLQSSTETNLGTLGVTGNGKHSGLVLSIPGALTGDSNTADDLSSASVRVPFSQALKLTAPFSVEGWFNPENTTLNAAISCGELGGTRSGWLIYDDGTGWSFRMYDTNGGTATVNISGGDVTVGMWHHVVATWDGTTATVYENGTLATSGTVTDLPFVPNTDGDLTIGIRSDGAFKWPGLADEVAIYTNLLSPADVAAHYQNGTNASPATPYKSLILAQHPLIYFRMDGGVTLPGGIASLPVATNYGSLGPSVNGIYYPGTQPGQSGPVGAGFGANNHSCHFVPSVGTAVECGTNSDLDIGLNPMTVVCWFKGGPTDYGNRFQSILGRSDGSWRADMDSAGIVRFVDGSPDCFGSTYANDNVWHFYAGVFDGAQEYVYLDGFLDASLVNTPHSDPTAEMRIGGVGDYGDRMFNGNVAQVALFTNALSQADLLNLYSAAALPISILRQPAAISTYAGLSANMSVYATGPTSYKWQKDGIDIPGQTSNTLVLSSLSLSDIGDYRAVLSNSLGTTNSQAAHLSVLASPPVTLNLSTGLVLHLKFNNDSFDYSGHGNHGTLVGAPTYVAGGIVGANALEYSTVSASSTFNYVTLGVRPDFQFSSNVNFSIAYWIRYVSGTDGDLPVIGTAVNSSYNAGICLFEDTGDWAWTLGSPGGVVAGDNGSPSPFTDLKWHHFALTCDRVGNGVAYLDGIQVGREPIQEFATVDTGNAMVIGQDPTGQYGVDGSADISDVGIWRRVLSPGEVGGMYLAGVSNHVSFVSTPLLLTITRVGAGQIQLSWLAGILQSATALKGPFTDLPNATTPYTTSAGAQMFYRLRE